MPQKKPEVSKEQIAQYFHLPLKEAAKNLDICESLLKKACRKHGIEKWPFRQNQANQRIKIKEDIRLRKRQQRALRATLKDKSTKLSPETIRRLQDQLQRSKQDLAAQTRSSSRFSLPRNQIVTGADNNNNNNNSETHDVSHGTLSPLNPRSSPRSAEQDRIPSSPVLPLAVGHSHLGVPPHSVPAQIHTQPQVSLGGANPANPFYSSQNSVDLSGVLPCSQQRVSDQHSRSCDWSLVAPPVIPPAARNSNSAVLLANNVAHNNSFNIHSPRGYTIADSSNPAIFHTSCVFASPESTVATPSGSAHDFSALDALVKVSRQDLTSAPQRNMVYHSQPLERAFPTQSSPCQALNSYQSQSSIRQPISSQYLTNQTSGQYLTNQTSGQYLTNQTSGQYLTNQTSGEICQPHDASHSGFFKTFFVKKPQSHSSTVQPDNSALQSANRFNFGNQAASLNSFVWSQRQNSAASNSPSLQNATKGGGSSLTFHGGSSATLHGGSSSSLSSTPRSSCETARPSLPPIQLNRLSDRSSSPPTLQSPGTSSSLILPPLLSQGPTSNAPGITSYCLSQRYV